jgi:hypothetical protein
MRIGAERVGNPGKSPGTEERIVVHRDLRAEVQSLRPREKKRQRGEGDGGGENGMSGHRLYFYLLTFAF